MWGVDVTLTQDVGCSLSADGGGADVAVGGDHQYTVYHVTKLLSNVKYIIILYGSTF